MGSAAGLEVDDQGAAVGAGARKVGGEVGVQEHSVWQANIGGVLCRHGTSSDKDRVKTGGIVKDELGLESRFAQLPSPG